jgi:endogenous inhibitor of DNA gyrase (YacG/DUF329 family)
MTEIMECATCGLTTLVETHCDDLRTEVKCTNCGTQYSWGLLARIMWHCRATVEDPTGEEWKCCNVR